MENFYVPVVLKTNIHSGGCNFIRTIAIFDTETADQAEALAMRKFGGEIESCGTATPEIDSAIRDLAGFAAQFTKIGGKSDILL